MHALNRLPDVFTGRLLIRPLVRADTGEVAALTDHPAITNSVDFLTSPFQVLDADEMISGIDGNNCFFGVFDAEKLVGVIGAHARGSDQVEIGYWIGKQFQRQGYASEAVSGFITQLRQLPSDNQITAECRPENHGSWNLLLKLGFRPSGRMGHRPGRQLLTLA